jgi:DNA (cytosine-5)-methyltransferase 1
LSTDNDKVVSLFSGAGGFSLGFSWAGIKPEFGVEINKDAAKTYETNIQHPCHIQNIETVDPSFLSENLSGKAPFAVIGGPPCQGFSTAGLRQHEDARNKLIYNYLRIVEHLQPRWFVFENVEGILTSGSGQAVFLLVREFLAIGYSVRVNKINFASHGVPQTRKRVLIIGNRVGIDFDLPPTQYSYDSGKSRLITLKKGLNPDSNSSQSALLSQKP